jgi:hypothetical protein
MNNWTDVIRQAGGRIPIYAIGPARSDSAAAYWGELIHHVKVLGAPATEINQALGVDATPVTLLIEDGRIVTQIPGPIRAAARADVLAFASARAGER